MSNEANIQYVADRISNVIKLIEKSEQNYDDTRGIIEKEINLISVFAEDNNVPFNVKADVLMSIHFEDSSYYEDESSSYYEEDDSSYYEDED